MGLYLANKETENILFKPIKVSRLGLWNMQWREKCWLTQLVAQHYRCWRSGFDSRAGQIRHRVANGSPLLRRFFGLALSRGDGPRHSLHASAQYHEYNKDLIFFWHEFYEIMQKLFLELFLDLEFVLRIGTRIDIGLELFLVQVCV